MPRKKETYESLMDRLHEVVSGMESEEIALDDSMKSYEEGIKICNKLYKMLNTAEEKVKILNGNEEKEFSGNDD